MYRFFFKRFFDFWFSFLVFVSCLPVFAIITLVLLFINKGRPFFYQLRPGKDEKIFKIIKFKSMTDETDKEGKLLPDFDRMTVFGTFIRKYSLDELPQLINVILGDMSVIGPRPLLVSYLERYNDSQRKRHQIRPGITGWAQVNGRNAITWEQKFQLDTWYVENYSLLVDIKIFFKTVEKVFKSEDIVSNENVTMEEFMGNN